MSMLSSSDPFFREFDRLTDGLLSKRTAMSSGGMPVDAYRHGDEFIMHFDLPGVDPESVEVSVEQSMLSIAAERSWKPEEGDQVFMAERPQGRYSRQLYLSDNLDTDRVDASYDAGVLTLRVPVSEKAKPRRVQVSASGGKTALDAQSHEST